MCGIIGAFGRDIEPGITALLHRGPDARGEVQVGDLRFGHTRLAILDLDHRSDQPMRRGRTTITFSGEIWNHKQVRQTLERKGRRFTTSGDVEVLAYALDCWGPEALGRLEGMFAVAWTRDGQELHLARDRFGEVPLHAAAGAFASEQKGLRALGLSSVEVGPGEHWIIRPDGSGQIKRWYLPPIAARELSLVDASRMVGRQLEAGVVERLIADVPVCALLSGGLDSSAITLLAAQHMPGLVAYTAVHDPRSLDLRCAREVAVALGVELREVPVPLPTPEDLAEVVRVIEMPHKAQVEIAWPCLHLARQMRADGFRVVFSGEGSDELWASYGFAYHGVKQKGWHPYRRDLVLTQARKNFARCNKVFMAHGVECRLPFLHRPLVELALSLPQAVVEADGETKAVLREAFRGRLPVRVINRPKVAFQDGLGIKQAIAGVVSDPARFYRAEHDRAVRTRG